MKISDSTIETEFVLAHDLDSHRVLVRACRSSVKRYALLGVSPIDENNRVNVLTTSGHRFSFRPNALVAVEKRS